MTVKRFLIGAIVVGAAVACALGIQFRFIAKPQFNVILVTLDTTRADHLGCYGYRPAMTPTIDALAERGVLFEHAYTPTPLTLPAHASILTGLYPFDHGLFTNGSHSLPDDIPTLAESLDVRGYATGAFVASFVLNRKFGLDRGFETYDDDVDSRSAIEPPGEHKRNADQVIDRAIAWLTGAHRNPFFCWIHLFDPHAEYLDHEQEFGDTFRSRSYDAEIAFVDMQLKRLIGFLDSQQLRDRTIIIITGDHGEGLTQHRERWHGYQLYNSTLRVPLIVSGPSIADRPRRVANPVSLVDLTPTVLDCLDIPWNAPASGRSLKPALSGTLLSAKSCYAVTREAFLEEGWSPQSCLMTADWKYIRSTKPELYDLRNDPDETQNLADTHEDALSELDQELEQLEANGRRQNGHAVSLSERERTTLAGIGYVGGRVHKGESSVPLTDLKDRLDHFDAWQGALDLCIRRQPELAITPLYALIGSAPDYLAPRLLLTKILMGKGNLDEAETQCLAILDIDPDNEQAHECLGAIRISQKQYEMALNHLLKALTISPLSPGLHMSAGRVFNALGRRREAAAQFQTAENLSNQESKRRRHPKAQHAQNGR